MAKPPVPITPKFKDDRARANDMSWLQQYHKNDDVTDLQTRDFYLDPNYAERVPQVTPQDIQNYIVNPEDVQAAQRTLPTPEEVMQYILRRGR